MDGFEQKEDEPVNQPEEEISEVNQPDSYYQPQAQPEQIYHAAPGEYYEPPMNRTYPAPYPDAQSQGYPQPQMYAQPQGYPQSQMYAQPQGYPQPQMYAQPQGYPQPQMYAQPQGYPQPQMYAQPQGYSQPGTGIGTGSYYDPSPSVGRNVTCMVFGILAFFMGFAIRDDGILSPTGIALELLFLILSTVFGILGLTCKTRGKGMSIAGLICSGFGILFSILSFANVIQ